MNSGDSIHIFLAVLLLLVFTASAAVHPSYAGFASPVPGYSLPDRNITFATSASISTISIATTDTAVYRYAYVSYDGGAWTPVTLSGTTLGGAWLNGSSTASIPISPSDFSLSPSKLTTRRNFVVTYSCSRTAQNTWDCHDGWQIWQFNASLSSQAAPELLHVNISASGCNDEAPLVADNNASTDWSCMYVNNITFSYSENVTMDTVSIMFGSGNTLSYFLSVQYSADGSSWVTLLDNVSSSGTTLAFENFSFAATTAPFFRIVGNCRTGAYPLWNVYREVVWSYQNVAVVPGTTCNDGVHNGDELATDCGPSCPDQTCCGNGLLDESLGEEGIDCGGSYCSACHTCNDNIQNGDEVGIDCGGSCPVCECSEHDVRSCSIDNGHGAQVRLCVDYSYRAWSSCSAQSCNPGFHIEGAACVPDSCHDFIVNQDEEGVDCGGVCADACGAESLMLSGVPLIHDQTFLLPDNAASGDTVGDLNLMWVSPGQDVAYSIVDDDGGRFSLAVLPGRRAVSNHLLDYEVRLSVAAPGFDHSVRQEHQFTVRATDQGTGEYSDAVVTVKLSDSDDTFFINPGCASEEGCCGQGTRACPYASWRSVTGSWTSWACGRNIIQPGTTYVQKRGSVYFFGAAGDYYGVCTHVSGTADGHITIGAYGSGDRPLFQSALVQGGGLVGGGNGIQFMNSNTSYYDVYSIAFARNSIGISTNSLGFDHMTFTDLHFNNTYGMGIYFWVTERDENNPFIQTDSGNRYAKLTDSVSEYAGIIPSGYADPMPNDNYGFKLAGSARIDVAYTVARFNEIHGFSVAGATGTFRYCQALSNGYIGIKAHGNDIVIDHTLVADSGWGQHYNAGIGVHRGSYYTAYGLFSEGFHLANSLIRNNSAGMHIEEDARDGIIERTQFIGSSNFAVYAMYTNPYPTMHTYVPAENFMFINNTFRNNSRCFNIGDGGEPLLKNISIIGNRFYDNNGLPIEVNEVDGLAVYNNVFYNNANANALRVDGTTYSLVVRNNLLGGAISAGAATSPVVDHNMNHADSFFVNATGRDFRLAPGSPAIDAGIDVGLPYTGSAPDVGAFEYAG